MHKEIYFERGFSWKVCTQLGSLFFGGILKEGESKTHKTLFKEGYSCMREARKTQCWRGSLWGHNCQIF